MTKRKKNKRAPSNPTNGNSSNNRNSNDNPSKKKQKNIIPSSTPQSTPPGNNDGKPCVISIKTTPESPPLNPLSPSILSNFLHPLPPSTFLKDHFRKNAIHIQSTSTTTTTTNPRLAPLLHHLHNGDMHSLYRHTSSDSIFIWLHDSQTGRIRSIDIPDPSTAHALYSTGGHASYCRAPPALEQALVSRFLKTTSLGFGNYDPTNERSQIYGRGEVELFAVPPSSAGHVTEWHFDFQENFTVQLSGRKRWRLRRGYLRDPLRGGTPHYASPDNERVWEGQVAAARLTHETFRMGLCPNETNSWGEEVVVELKPGDVFYFPAGMWHKVEPVEDGVASLSMNVSLMARNYASVVSEVICHLLNGDVRWREVVGVGGASGEEAGAMGRLEGLLRDLPDLLVRKGLCGPGGAGMVIPPVLQFPPANDDDDDDDDDDNDAGGDDDEDGGDDNPTEEDNNNDDNDDDDPSNDDDIISTTTSSSSPQSSATIIDVNDCPYPPGWTPPLPTTTKRLMKNPLASLLPKTDVTCVAKDKTNNKSSSSEEDDDGPDDEERFILNVSFSGNDMHESAVRVILHEAKGGDDMLRRCCEWERRGEDPAGLFSGKEKTTDGDDKAEERRCLFEWPKGCLFFYGYFVLT